MTLTSINTVTLGTAWEADVRDVTTGTAVAYPAAAITYNTLNVSFDTIQLAKVVGGDSGDTLRISVFKGSIPDDPNDPTDDNETAGVLDINDFLESVDVVLDADIPAEGITDVQFDFNTVFNKASLGETYTLVIEQFDSSSNPVPFSHVYCQDRDGVSNFLTPEDEGYPTEITAVPQTAGGAGNSYRVDNSSGLDGAAVSFNFEFYTGFMTGASEAIFDPVIPAALFYKTGGPNLKFIPDYYVYGDGEIASWGSIAKFSLADGESMTIDKSQYGRHDIDIDSGSLEIQVEGVGKGTVTSSETKNLMYKGKFTLVAAGAVTGEAISKGRTDNG